jgi:hypothetical protein
VANPFAGKWHYRSFHNIAEPASKLDDLLFGEGEFLFDDVPIAEFTGSADFGNGYTMKFFGNSSFGNPMAMRFQGVGPGPSNSDWVYDYIGFLVPRWPNGVDEVRAIVGSVVRTMPHNAGKAAAGVVASFVVVKK